MAEKDADKWQAWRDRLRRFQAGELTVAEFCQRERVSTAVFYQWRRKLAGQVAASGRVGRASVETLPDFVEVQITHQGTKPKIMSRTGEHVDERVEIRLPNGTCVLIAAHDVRALQAAIAAAGELGMREAAGGEAC